MTVATLFLMTVSVLVASLCKSDRLHEGNFVLQSRSRRSDDSSPNEAVLNQHSQELAHLNAQLVALKTDMNALKARTTDLERVVCFTVHFTQPDIRGLGLNQPLVFDSVAYNAGNGYNSNTGIFTAPAPGTYVFALTVQRHGSDETNIILYIKKGNHIIALAEAGYSPHEHGAMVVNVHLEQGDVISVQSGLGTMLYGSLSTVFSGFRLSPQ